jgi:hypothetical protein
VRHIIMGSPKDLGDHTLLVYGRAAVTVPPGVGSEATAAGTSGATLKFGMSACAALSRLPAGGVVPWRSPGGVSLNGFALRRDDDDDGKPSDETLRDRAGRLVDLIREAFMSFAQPHGPAEVTDIQRMGRLVPDWNGHGAHAVPLAARDHATHFLQVAESKFGMNIPRPTIGAIDGGLVFVWRAPMRKGAPSAGEREIEMIFFDNGNEWSVADRDGIEPTLSGENADYDRLLRIIDRYILA